MQKRWRTYPIWRYYSSLFGHFLLLWSGIPALLFTGIWAIFWSKFAWVSTRSHPDIYCRLTGEFERGAAKFSAAHGTEGQTRIYLQGRLKKYMETERLKQLHWYHFFLLGKMIVSRRFRIKKSVFSSMYSTCKDRTFKRIHSIVPKA